jgi:hypothetical protein
MTESKDTSRILKMSDEYVEREELVGIRSFKGAQESGLILS